MERDKRIDVLRAWGIFLVIAVHSGSPFSGFIYTFHMPLFFFITGYLRYNGKVYSWRSFIAKKIKSVLVPYVIFWVVSMLIYNQIKCYMESHTLATIGMNELLGLLGGGHWLADYSNNFPLWYFQLYFIACICFEIVVRYFNKILQLIFLIVTAVVTIPFQNMVPGRPVFHINVLPAALTFMMIGYGFKYLIDKDLHLYDKIKGNYAIACVLIALGWKISTINYGDISNIVSYLYFFGATCTIMGTYIFANLFINNKLFQNVGKNTIYILGLHFLLLEVSVSMMVYFIANIGITNTFVQNLLVILIDLFLCCGLAELYKIIKGLVVAKLKKGTQQNKE